MNKFKEFFRSKAFYIAFGTGILCFSGLLLAYNYSDNRQGLKKEQAIDLNQPVLESDEVAEGGDNLGADIAPVESDGVLTGDEVNELKNSTYEDENAADEQTALNDDETNAVVDSNDGQSAVVATLTDSGVELLPAEVEETAPVASDYATTMDELIAAYSYDGEQSLAWPLNGDIILPYSMDTTVYYATLKTYKCNPGILISGTEGANVVSAYDGVVESITEDKEHGTVVTVNMGNGYTTSYGQLMNVTVSEGEEVVLGQVIGEIAPVTAYYTEEGTHLYFDMKKDGEPVNPILFIQ